MRTDVDDWWEYGWVFHAMNTNKRSVTLDLESDDGIGCSSELVAGADVVIENFSPAGDGPIRARPPTCCSTSSPTGRRPDAGVRAGRSVARPGRLRADHGADRRPGLGDRPAGGAAGAAARRVRPAGGRACGVRVVAALNSPTAPGCGQLVEVPMIETVLNVTARSRSNSRSSGRSCRAARQPGHIRPAAHWISTGARDWHDWSRFARTTDAQRTALSELTGGDRARGMVRRAGPRWPPSMLLRAQVFRLRRRLAVLGDRQPPTAPSRLLRTLEHPRTGEGLYPTSAVRKRARRAGHREMAASAPADAGSAQRARCSRAVRADVDADFSTDLAARGCHRSTSPKALPVTNAASGISPSRRRSTCCSSGWGS
jgi:hypothetical protein